MEMEQKSFLPDFCGVRAVLAVVVSSVVLAMVIALASVDRLEQLWSGFSMAALYVLWIALASAGVFCLARRWLAGMSHARVGFLAWLLVLLVCAAVAEAVAWLMPVELVAGISHLDLLVRTLGIGAILAALILRYRYEYHLQRQQELAEDQARYLALQARIRPHFLFNSLNTVISLVPNQPEKAQQILHDLSDLFRASLGSRCPPWRAKRRRVVPGSREATRDTRRAEGAKGDPKGASERGVQSYGRPVCSRNELAMLWRNAG